jgi:hypothetical protein
MVGVVSTGDDGPERSRWRRCAEAVLLVVAVYGFAGGTYIALNAIVHPNTLRVQLTHLSPWPHEDTFGAISFGISFVCALLYGISRNV